MELRKIVGFGAMAAAVAVGGYYYFYVYSPAKMAAKNAQSAARATASAPVMVARVAQEAVPLQIGTIGNVSPVSTVSIKSLVDGQIFKVGFQEGQIVQKGDLLFQIDPRPFVATLQKAQAALESDKSQVVRADLDLKRFAELAKKDFAPQQQYEQARAAADVAHASVLADEAAIDQAKLNLEYCQIRSPIDGRTGNILINVGNLVKANDTTALVMINQLEPIYVSFSIPQNSLPEVRKRMALGALPVTVTIPGDSGGPVDGEVTFINNQVDVTTGTIQLKATIGNNDKRHDPGQIVKVTMTLNTLTGALVVPTQAVQSGQNGTYVYVVRPDNTVEQRLVEVGPTIDAKSVIEKGLEAGEQVVTDGQLRLFPGAAVEIRNAA